MLAVSHICNFPHASVSLKEWDSLQAEFIINLLGMPNESNEHNLLWNAQKKGAI